MVSKNNKFCAVAAIAVTALIVSACGGGGGGGGTSPAAAPAVTYLLAGTNTTLRTLSATQTFDAISVTIKGNDSAVLLPETTRIPELDTTKITLRPTAADPMGNYQAQVQASLPPGTTLLNQTWNVNSTNNVAFIAPHTDMKITAFPSAGSSSVTGLLFTNNLSSASSTLNYQMFGFWLQEVTVNRTDGGFFSVGVATLGGSVPATGSATYLGSFFGIADNDVTNAASAGFYLSTKVNANVDFAARRVDFAMTDGQVTSSRTSPFTSNNSFNVSGTLNWNAGENVFRGTVSNGTLSGNAAGRFYGPEAKELGGVLHAINVDGTKAVSGAFGAAQVSRTP